MLSNEFVTGGEKKDARQVKLSVPFICLISLLGAAHPEPCNYTLPIPQIWEPKFFLFCFVF